MIPVNFVPLALQLQDIANEFRLTQGEHDQMLDSMVKGITRSFADIWRQEAGLKLHRSRVSFQKSIQVVDSGLFSGSVVLFGVVNNMIEQGCAAFDMKVGFAKSTNKKPTKSGGWYITVPFRWASPGAGGYSEVFSGVLPDEIHRVIQSLEISTSRIGTGVEGGGGLSNDQIPEQYRTPKVRGEFTDILSKKKANFGLYENKSSIYEGIGKGKKEYESAEQGQYVSFRRVSDKSDIYSWIHTGIMARNLGDRALERLDIERIVEVERDNFLSLLLNH